VVGPKRDTKTKKLKKQKNKNKKTSRGQTSMALQETKPKCIEGPLNGDENVKFCVK